MNLKTCRIAALFFCVLATGCWHPVSPLTAVIARQLSIPDPQQLHLSLSGLPREPGTVMLLGKSWLVVNDPSILGDKLTVSTHADIDADLKVSEMLSGELVWPSLFGDEVRFTKSAMVHLHIENVVSKELSLGSLKDEVLRLVRSKEYRGQLFVVPRSYSGRLSMRIQRSDVSDAAMWAELKSGLKLPEEELGGLLGEDAMGASVKISEATEHAEYVEFSFQDSATFAYELSTVSIFKATDSGGGLEPFLTPVPADLIGLIHDTMDSPLYVQNEYFGEDEDPLGSPGATSIGDTMVG